jgi:hypothetical protein
MGKIKLDLWVRLPYQLILLILNEYFIIDLSKILLKNLFFNFFGIFKFNYSRKIFLIFKNVIYNPSICDFWNRNIDDSIWKIDIDFKNFNYINSTGSIPSNYQLMRCQNVKHLSIKTPYEKFLLNSKKLEYLYISQYKGIKFISKPKTLKHIEIRFYSESDFFPLTDIINIKIKEINSHFILESNACKKLETLYLNEGYDERCRYESTFTFTEQPKLSKIRLGISNIIFSKKFIGYSLKELYLIEQTDVGTTLIIQTFLNSIKNKNYFPNLLTLYLITRPYMSDMLLFNNDPNDKVDLIFNRFYHLKNLVIRSYIKNFSYNINNIPKNIKNFIFDFFCFPKSRQQHVYVFLNKYKSIF